VNTGSVICVPAVASVQSQVMGLSGYGRSDPVENPNCCPTIST